MESIAWRPGVGDPTVAGWSSVVLYLASGACALMVAVFLDRTGGGRSEMRFWAVIAVLFGMLAVNKQLDLQTLFTDIGRIVAKRQGWYEDRAIVQGLFVTAVFGGGVAAAVILARLWRRSPAPARLAQAGALLVAGFVALRASYFHGLDRFISAQMLDALHLNTLLEAGGTALVLAGALWRRASFPQDRCRPSLRGGGGSAGDLERLQP